MASKVFPAAFGSSCSECLGRIDEGDPIRMVNGEAIHEDCYNPADDDEDGPYPWEDNGKYEFKANL